MNVQATGIAESEITTHEQNRTCDAVRCRVGCRRHVGAGSRGYRAEVSDGSDDATDSSGSSAESLMTAAAKSTSSGPFVGVDILMSRTTIRKAFVTQEVPPELRVLFGGWNTIIFH